MLAKFGTNSASGNVSCKVPIWPYLSPCRYMQCDIATGLILQFAICSPGGHTQVRVAWEKQFSMLITFRDRKTKNSALSFAKLIVFFSRFFQANSHLALSLELWQCCVVQRDQVTLQALSCGLPWRLLPLANTRMGIKVL